MQRIQQTPPGIRPQQVPKLSASKGVRGSWSRLALRWREKNWSTGADETLAVRARAQRFMNRHGET